MTIPQTKLELMRMIVTILHGEQKYGDFPYTKHLEDVYDVAIELGATNEDDLVSALGHDLLEDTLMTYKLLVSYFGIYVAENIWCVTDENGKNRKERHEKTYPKLRANQRAVFIKLCDRIANMRNCIKTGNNMIYMYKKEYEHFKYGIQDEENTDPLVLKGWKVLDQIFANIK
jgi:(p)ppGpp synthase/HD superfamily hydrolase